MSLIPKVFHQIWLQGNLPDEYKYLRDHMLELHPGWEYKLWTEENRPKLFNEEIYSLFDKLCYKADILRYEIIHKLGGIYIDTDFLFFKNIENLINDDFFITREFPKNVVPNINNCIIGASPKHWLLEYVIMKIPESYIKYNNIPKNKRNWTHDLDAVGPRFFDRIIREIAPEIATRAIDAKYFSPFGSYAMPEAQYKTYPEAYAIHLWNHRLGSSVIDIHKTLPCYKRKMIQS